MKPWELLARTPAPGGGELTLRRRDREYIIQADGQSLMSSRVHHSEDALARLGCSHARTLPQPHVLIGGLGMGFTLRAALDTLPPAAVIVVAELVPAVIEWNRGPLGELAQHPLQDPRVQIMPSDVSLVLTAQQRFHAILLDVDNGPDALTTQSNAGLYSKAGLAAAHAALHPGGTLAIWSAREDAAFAQRLRRSGFRVQRELVRGQTAERGSTHAIILASR